MQGGAGDFGGVQNAQLDQVAILAVGGVVAKVAFAFQHLVHDHAGFVTGVDDDFAQGRFNGLEHELDAGVLVGVGAFDVASGLTGAQQGHAAASDDAFFHGSAGGVQGVFHTGFLFFHFHFGGSAYLDDGHAAGEFGHALLQFFAVVVAGGFFDLHADLLDARLNVFGLASAVDDGGVFLAHFDGFGLAQIGQRHFFKRQAHFFGNDFAAGEDGDVFQHGLAAVAEAGGLDGHHFQDAANGVHHQRGQGFAFHVFGNDEQRTAGLGHGFQRGQQVADVADLLVKQQHVGVFQHGGLFVGVVDEVGAEVATVELHAFDHVQLVVQALAVFHGDDAFLAHFVHGVGNDLADGFVRVGGNGADLGDFLAGGGGLAGFFQLLDEFSHGFVDAALQVHRVHAGGHVFHAFAHDGLGQHGSGGGAVASGVAGFGGHFLDHLCAHVLELVFQLDFLGDGHAVFGDGGRAEAAFQHHVAAFGAQGCLHGVGQDVHAFNHAGAGVRAENNVFCCHLCVSP